MTQITYWPAVLLMLAGFALPTQERPGSLFREDWKELPAAARKRERLNTSSLVYPGNDGKLIYVADERGNRIPDFSHAGYGGGGAPLPQAPVKATVAPGEGDDGARIQAAIDAVSKMPLDKRGLRGAALLKKGRYEIAGTLRIAASGVVLRGEGHDENGTTLIATGTQKRTLIEAGGAGEPREFPGARTEITDAYVPVGAYSFHVKEAADGAELGYRLSHERPRRRWILGIVRPAGRTAKPVPETT
jgi:hypothetical protein